MAADSEHHKVAEHALAMLKVVYSREGPNAAVESAKHIVVVAAAVISQELGPAEAQRFLQVVGAHTLATAFAASVRQSGEGYYFWTPPSECRNSL
jgi:hypothetical protein